MDQRLIRILRDQAGVFGHHQARALGVTDRQLHCLCLRGELIRPHPTVFAHAAVAPTPESAFRACSLWLGPEATATGWSAAWWWGLIADVPPHWHFTTTHQTHLKKRPGVRVSRSFVDPYDRAGRLGVGVIGLALAVLRGAVDLERDGRGRGVALVDRAKQRRLISPADLDAAFRRNRGTWGTTAMRALLEHTEGRANSELERKAVGALRRAGITGFRINHRVRLGSGRPVELDIAFPELKLAIELDGFAFHSTPEQLAADHRRQRELMDDGWTVRRFTWADVVDDPDGFVRAVLALLP